MQVVRLGAAALALWLLIGAVSAGAIAPRADAVAVAKGAASGSMVAVTATRPDKAEHFRFARETRLQQAGDNFRAVR